MLYVQEQTSFIPEATEKEKQVSNRYDVMIEHLTNFLNQSFSKDDMNVLASVLTPVAKQNIDKIDLIIWHLNKIKRALMQSDSTREIIEQTALAM